METLDSCNEQSEARLSINRLLNKEEKYDLAGLVIGCAMKVHRALGPGFLESVYANALAIELDAAGIPYLREAPVAVHYGEYVVGEFRSDFLVHESLIVELKAVSNLNPAHAVQTVNYLSATHLPEGLLLNFGAQSLEYKKKFQTYKKPEPDRINSCNERSEARLSINRISEDTGEMEPSPHPDNSDNSVNSVNSVKKSPDLHAFTLLELLVAMAVLAILVVMMMGLVTSATALWRSSENRVDAYREARAALSIMTRDLQSTIATTNPNLMRLNADAFTHLDSGKAITNPLTASALFFHTALPKKAQDSDRSKSDVCQVGYFLAFDRTALSTNLPGSQPTLNLYRYFLSSDDTFAALTNSTPNVPFANNITTLSGAAELLARNIREFRITPYVHTNGSLTTNFTQSTNQPLPDLLEITITAVNQEAARRFTSKSDWTSTTPPEGLTNAQQTFTTRVRLNQPAN